MARAIDSTDRFGIGALGRARESLGVLDRGGHLAAEHVRRDDREPGRGQPVGIRDDVVVQAPPRVEDDDAWSSRFEFAGDVKPDCPTANIECLVLAHVPPLTCRRQTVAHRCSRVVGV